MKAHTLCSAADKVDVLIIGAGPTGLTAAIAARRHGLSVRIIDRSAQRTSYSKALVLHARSMEVFDDLGCIERIRASGREFRALNIYGKSQLLQRVEFSSLAWGDALYPMWFSIPQSSTERCLEEHLQSIGTQVERELALVHFEQQKDCVDVTVQRVDGTTEQLCASWVIGCDGAKSEVRKLLDVPLQGEAGSEVFILADVTLETAQERGLVDAEGYNILAEEGLFLIVPMDVPGKWRLIAQMPELSVGDTPEIDQPMLQGLIDRRSPIAAKVSSVGWTSHFVPKHLMANELQMGRVFLSGDAAHLHSPVGGQGLNTGIQDVYNLLWKLALAQRRSASPTLLATYHSERHAIGKDMIDNVHLATRALTLRSGLRQTVRNQFARRALQLASVRNRLGRNVGMLDLRYPKGDAIARKPAILQRKSQHWVGARAPLVRSSPSLWNALRGPEHVLLVFDGGEGITAVDLNAVLQTATSLRTTDVRIVFVRGSVKSEPPANSRMFTTLPDTDLAIHRAYHCNEATLFWVRPDKYIAFALELASKGSDKSNTPLVALPPECPVRAYSESDTSLR